MRYYILFFLVLATLPTSSSAWMPQTYEALSKRLCDYYSCECQKEIIGAVTKPDKLFRDEPSQHCYKPELKLKTEYNLGETELPICPNLNNLSRWDVASDCYVPELDNLGYIENAWQLPVLNDCPALDKVSSWLDSASKKNGCARWHDIGIAFHYFLDSKEFWNNVILVNKTCRQEHEDLVNDYVRLGSKDYTACSCGICVSGDDFNNWINEYAQRIKPLVNAYHEREPTVVILHNELDLEAVSALKDYLVDEGVTVNKPTSLIQALQSEFLVIVGGHNAPFVGPYIDGVLTDSDKDKILKSIFSGVSIRKSDVWISGQTVLFIAGYGVAETQDAVDIQRSLIANMSKTISSSTDKLSECVLNSDCGSKYWGPWVCQRRDLASRVEYTPYCSFGQCKLRAERPSTKGCVNGRFCEPLIGCLSSEKLVRIEAKQDLIFTSWLSHLRETILVGRNLTYSLYFRNNLTSNPTNFICQVYDDEDGWVDEPKFLSGSKRLEHMFNHVFNTTGRKTIVHKVRCGNITDDDEVISMYQAEHNFTADVMPPALVFSFTLVPQTLQLNDCFDAGNVSLKIQNIIGTNINCNYSIGGYEGLVDVSGTKDEYNITGYKWTWTLENETYYYLSYYSGADFKELAGNNTYYDRVDEEDDITTRVDLNSTLLSYANISSNITIWTPTITKIYNNNSYMWDYNPWETNNFWIDSNECEVDKYLVRVTCTDVWGQHVTLEKDLKLNLTHLANVNFTQYYDRNIRHLNNLQPI